MRSAIKDTLADHTPLAILLPGGIYDDQIEISRAHTPGAFDEDTKELLPCCLIKLNLDSADGPNDTGSSTFVDLYWYQRRGFDVIDQAKDLARDLLHRQKIGTNSDQVFEARWLNDVPDTEDGALLSSLCVSRYQIARYIG